MINEFKIGYYYKYIGDKYNYSWYSDDVKLILNGKWYKCIDNIEYGDKNYSFAQFEGINRGCGWLKEDFIETKYNPYVKKLLEEI